MKVTRLRRSGVRAPLVESPMLDEADGAAAFTGIL
jgi:hypothetical protein